MGGRQAYRHQEVVGLVPLGQHHAIGDFIGLYRYLHVAFVAHIAVRRRQSLHIVRVAVVGAHADAVGLGSRGLQVALLHDVFPRHAAAFAHVKLVGPVVGVGEFILGATPAVHFGL